MHAVQQRKHYETKPEKDTMLRCYKDMAVPTLMYGSECWAMNTAEKRAAEAAEMAFLRYIAGYTRKDQVRNKNIRQTLNIFNLNDRIQHNKKNWYEHIFYVWIQELPNKFYSIKPIGHRNIGRPRPWWEDDLETERPVIAYLEFIIIIIIIHLYRVN
jgi:hypothetical protein